MPKKTAAEKKAAAEERKRKAAARKLAREAKKEESLLRNCKRKWRLRLFGTKRRRDLRWQMSSNRHLSQAYCLPGQIARYRDIALFHQPLRKGACQRCDAQAQFWTQVRAHRPKRIWKSTMLWAIASREIPIPDHCDIWHLHEEAKPSDLSV